MSKILSGTVVATQILASAKNDIEQFDTKPHLQIIVVGHHPASEIYIKRKQRAAHRLGISVGLTRFDVDCTTERLIETIGQLNEDSSVSAILVQMPLPPAIDRLAVLSSIKPTKDVDGLHPLNLGLLMNNCHQLVPATAKGILKMLTYYQVPLSGRDVVVIGRSILVGQPTALLLSQAGATVTVAHRQTTDLEVLLGQAHIIISAAGQPGLIKPANIRPDTVIIDVGITRLDDGLSGDANLIFELGEVAAISPVPGGVGPLTVACLMENIVLCHQLNTSEPSLTSP